MQCCCLFSRNATLRLAAAATLNQIVQRQAADIVTQGMQVLYCSVRGHICSVRGHTHATA
jgi:hypothetical protein